MGVQQPVVHTAVQQHVQTYAAPAVVVAAAPAAAVGYAAAPAAAVGVAAAPAAGVLGYNGAIAGGVLAHGAIAAAPAHAAGLWASSLRSYKGSNQNIIL